MVAGGTAYWVTRRCSPRLNWDLDTWKVQFETSASCYRVMRALSDYVTVHLPFDRMKSSGGGFEDRARHVTGTLSAGRNIVR